MYTLERTTLIPAPRDEVFEFFSDVARLKDITPKSVGFEDTTPNPGPMSQGKIIGHRIRWFGIPINWTTVIETFDPPHGFVDRQKKGPYKHWRHEHIFEEAGDETLMRDRVEYDLPFGPLGSITHALVVKRQLAYIFDFRARRIRKLFAKAKAAA